MMISFSFKSVLLDDNLESNKLVNTSKQKIMGEKPKLNTHSSELGYV